MRVELPTKINGGVKYKPVVVAIESTMFLKSESMKTSEKVRPPFSFERPSIPLTVMNMATNWMVWYQAGGLPRLRGCLTII